MLDILINSEIYDVNGNIHPDCALNQGHMGLKISSDQISKSNHEYETKNYSSYPTFLSKCHTFCIGILSPK